MIKKLSILLILLIIFFNTNIVLSNTSSSKFSHDFKKNDPRNIWKNLPEFDFDNDQSEIIAQFPQDFLFGVATASSHAEDNLNDVWKVQADLNKVNAFNNVSNPYQRLRFFSHPEDEISLAHKLGVNIFRFSISWERLVPKRPSQKCLLTKCEGIINKKALNRYIEIIDLIKSYNMKVMITLFHHDLPSWLIPGYHPTSKSKLGWLDDSADKFFINYVDDLIIHIKDKVDYVVTFNEPTLFAFLTHIVNVFPSNKPKITDGFNVFLNLSEYFQVTNKLVNLNKQLYHLIKSHNKQLPVGLVHVVPYYEYPEGLNNFLADILADLIVTNGFPDSIINDIDFLGINYYAEERASVVNYGLDLTDSNSISDSGRVINPKGLYNILKHFHNRYKDRRPDLYYFITENGLADNIDLTRMIYLVEHLTYLDKALKSGIPVKGYIHWTISDNWEWADGYCPKFGLVHVDRENNLFRTPRPSFYIYQKIITDKIISNGLREYAFNIGQKMLDLRQSDSEFADQWDGNRDFCRDKDGISGLDTPLRLPFSPYSPRN